jgi:RNA polymerase sigma factor (sigma-70 family)
MDESGARQARFEQLYGRHGRAVLAYAVRRAADPQDAADVVADTFMVAWRRLDAVPSGDEERLWLYGVARRVSANHERSERRRERLGERLRRDLPCALSEVDDGQGAASRGLLTLGPEDQEVLRLTAWEELTPVQIASVLDLSQVAVRSRLHRARRRLRVALRAASTDAPCPPAQLEEIR